MRQNERGGDWPPNPLSTNSYLPPMRHPTLVEKSATKIYINLNFMSAPKHGGGSHSEIEGRQFSINFVGGTMNLRNT